MRETEIKGVTIGNQIAYLIEKRKPDLEMLTRGICSVSSIRRLINGETVQSFFLVKCLLERLGTSVNKVNSMIDRNENGFYIMREFIKRMLIAENYNNAEKILLEYREEADLKNSLHLQYVLTIEAIVVYERDNNPKEALKLFRRALECTIEKFDIERINEFLLGEEELILVIIILNIEMEYLNKDIGNQGYILLEYVNKHFADEEAKINTYTKLAWIIGESHIKSKRYGKALEISLESVEMLTDNGLLIHLPQFLDRILSLLPREETRLYRNRKKQRDALHALYDEFGEGWNSDNVCLWESYRPNNVYLISEIVKNERNIKGYSQEEVAEKIGIDTKTVSRVESGRTSPKRGTFQLVKKYFGLEIDNFQTRLAVEDFYLLDIEREISRLSMKRRYKEAEELFNTLKIQLPMCSKINMQYIAFMEALFGRYFKRKSEEETIMELEEAFCITKTRPHLENIGEFVTTDLEAKILNLMAACYKKKGNIEKSIEILEKAVKSYEGSDSCHGYGRLAMGLLYINLSVNYEEAGRLKEGMECINNTIRHYLKYKRGDSLGHLVSERAYIEDKIRGDNLSGREVYKQSYQLMELMKTSEGGEKAALRKAFNSWYGEDIEE